MPTDAELAALGKANNEAVGLRSSVASFMENKFKVNVPAKLRKEASPWAYHCLLTKDTFSHF